jgi:hypothetical protein
LMLRDKKRRCLLCVFSCAASLGLFFVIFLLERFVGLQQLLIGQGAGWIPD